MTGFEEDPIGMGASPIRGMINDTRRKLLLSPAEERYHWHRLGIVFENGHQEGTTETLTRGSNSIIITGVACVSCDLRISWETFRSVKLYDLAGHVTELPFGPCKVLNDSALYEERLKFEALPKEEREKYIRQHFPQE